MDYHTDSVCDFLCCGLIFRGAVGLKIRGDAIPKFVFGGPLLPVGRVWRSFQILTMKESMAG